MHPPVLVEHNCRKSLQSLLMPSILSTPPDTNPGCFRCNKWLCIICTSHLAETFTFSSSTMKEAFQICHRLTCQSSNIVYILYWNTCQQSQYVGLEKQRTRTRPDILPSPLNHQQKHMPFSYQAFQPNGTQYPKHKVCCSGEGTFWEAWRWTPERQVLD